MPRRRIGDGTSPHVLGLIILNLVERERDRDGGGWPRNGGGGATPPRTATNLAAQMGLSPTQVRVAANELARARCLRLRRTATSRTENSGRYAQGFFLPGPTEERGPGRSPRLRPVVLLIESNQAIADAMGRVLRELGALPLGVSDLHEARRVLEHLAFELVVVGEPGDAAGAADDGASDLGPAAWAARCGPVIARGGAVGAPDGAARAGGGWSLGLAGFRVAAAAALGVRPAAAAAVSRHAIVRDDEMLAPAFD